jgi:hypothetical protein
MTGFNLAQYKLELAVIEVRFKDAFRLWDNSGAIWSQIADRYPGAKQKSAMPNATNFNIDKDLDLHIELARASVQQFLPSADLSKLAEVSTVVLETVGEYLKIREYSRVGLRMNYWREYESAQLAAKAFAETISAHVFGSLSPQKDGELKGAETVARWESKSVGISVAARVLSRKVNIELPIGMGDRIEVKGAEETHGILLDLDYFTIGSVPIDQIRPRLWLESAAQSLRRALRVFNRAD